MRWQTIDTAPKGRTVLIHYKNSLGNGRTVKARYVERFTVEDDSGLGEYCEDKDEYYLLEGWYEQVDNWDDFAEIFIHCKPTHWMPLPAPPGDTT